MATRTLTIYDGIKATFRSDADAERFKATFRENDRKAMHWHDCLGQLLEAADEDTYPEETDTERALENIARLRADLATITGLFPGVPVEDVAARLQRARQLLVNIEEWATALTPADGIKYGAYYPQFAINEAIRLLDAAPTDEDG